MSEVVVKGFAGKSGSYCKVGKTYSSCEKGSPCFPVEGHLVTECKKCENFG